MGRHPRVCFSPRIVEADILEGAVTGHEQSVLPKGAGHTPQVESTVGPLDFRQVQDWVRWRISIGLTKSSFIGCSRDFLLEGVVAQVLLRIPSSDRVRLSQQVFRLVQDTLWDVLTNSIGTNQAHYLVN